MKLAEGLLVAAITVMVIGLWLAVVIVLVIAPWPGKATAVFPLVLALVCSALLAASWDSYRNA